MDASVWAALRPHLQNVVEIDFSGGGEPLLHPDLAEWIAEAKQAGCRAGFLTNGSLLDEATASRMIRAGVDWIALSADGARAETFENIRKGASFEAFCENVRRLTGMRMGKVPRVIVQFRDDALQCRATTGDRPAGRGPASGPGELQTVRRGPRRAGAEARAVRIEGGPRDPPPREGLGQGPKTGPQARRRDHGLRLRARRVAGVRPGSPQFAVRPLRRPGFAMHQPCHRRPIVLPGTRGGHAHRALRPPAGRRPAVRSGSRTCAGSTGIGSKRG